MMTRLPWPLAFFLGSILLTGCGDTASSVSGRVTLDGKALERGVVTFYPVEDGPAASGAVGPDGTYSLKTGSRHGLNPGEYTVTVAAQEDPTGDVKTGRPPPFITPKRYASQATSGLRETVRSGSNRIDLALQSP